MWLEAKTEGLMCLWMMLNTMIKNILKSRERAVASNEMPRHSIPPGPPLLRKFSNFAKLWAYPPSMMALSCIENVEVKDREQISGLCGDRINNAHDQVHHA